MIRSRFASKANKLSNHSTNPQSRKPQMTCVLMISSTPASLHVWIRLQSSPFFSLPTSERRGCAAGDWCEMRGRAGLEKRAGRVPHGRASHTSRLPRTCVRWLGEKKRDCFEVCVWVYSPFAYNLLLKMNPILGKPVLCPKHVSLSITRNIFWVLRCDEIQHESRRQIEPGLKILLCC